MQHSSISYLKPLFFLSLLALLPSCFEAISEIENPRISGALVQPSKGGEQLKAQLNELAKDLNIYKSDRQGGGDFGYEIQNQKDHHLLQINHANFKSFAAGEKTIKILKEAPAGTPRKEGELEIIALMHGACVWTLNEPPPACPSCATGTWKKEFIQYLNPENQAGEKLLPIYGTDGCSGRVDFLKIENLARTLVGDT